MSTLRRIVFAGAVLLAACSPATVIGSTCESGDCAELPSCSESEQQYPESCDKDAGICHDVQVESDEKVCNACFAMIEALDVGSPLAPCGCTYCGLQLTACFASAETEPEGDSDRDKLCRAIVECGWAAGCEGSECYCGKGVNRDTCLKNANEGRAQGECAELIQQAAACKRNELPGSCVFARQLTPDGVLDRATDLAKCVSGDPHLPSFTIEPMCR